MTQRTTAGSGSKSPLRASSLKSRSQSPTPSPEGTKSTTILKQAEPQLTTLQGREKKTGPTRQVKFSDPKENVTTNQRLMKQLLELK